MALRKHYLLLHVNREDGWAWSPLWKPIFNKIESKHTNIARLQDTMSSFSVVPTKLTS